MKFHRLSKTCSVLIAATLVALPSQIQAATRPRCNGLMIRNYVNETTSYRPTFINSVVIQVDWRDLEPTGPGSTGSGWAKINNARTALTNSGVVNPKIRLRILAGRQSPGWAMILDGPPVSIFHPQDDAPSDIPRFWGTVVNGVVTQRLYLNAYRNLMMRIQAIYGSDSRLCEVVASGTMTRYAEPFYRAATDGPSNQLLYNAGLNYATDLAAQQEVINIHKTVFPEIRTSLAINNWDIIVPVTASPIYVRRSFAETRAFADWAKTQLGSRLVLQNNGTGLDADPDSGTADTNHFNYLKNIAVAPKGFQTRQLGLLSSNPPDQKQALFDTIRLCDDMGANFVELPGGINALFTDFAAATSELQPYQTLINANSSENFATWAASWSLTGAAASPLATPANDGISNLLKFAARLNPSVPATAANIFGTAWSTSTGEKILTITFRRNREALDLSYAVQSSPDLLTWIDEPVPLTLVNPDVDGDGKADLVQAVINWGTATQGFLRLKASQ